MDLIFSSYLRKSGATRKLVRSDLNLRSVQVPDGVWQDLLRGWYNEFAFAFPAKQSTLGMSFADIASNAAATESRFLFPSWRIVTAYYAIYFYLRAITRLVQPSFRLAEHNATIVNFKACALGPLRRHLWRFPFTIDYSPHTRGQQRHPELNERHMGFKYARHPRAPSRSPAEIVARTRREFTRRGTAGARATQFTIFDYMRDFRVWANYLEIEHLLNLRGTGYKAFLDQNLSAIVFMVGGIAEVAMLSATTPTRFHNKAQRFYELVCDAGGEYERHFQAFPMSQRLEILHRLGWLHRPLRYRVRPNPNQVQIAEGV